MFTSGPNLNCLVYFIWVKGWQQSIFFSGTARLGLVGLQLQKPQPYPFNGCSYSSQSQSDHYIHSVPCFSLSIILDYIFY